MDYIRSCYSCLMYSFDPVSGAMIPFTARWYRPPRGALPIGIHHQYGSGIWDMTPTGIGDVGEVSAAVRTYDKGMTAVGVSGRNRCGSPEQWIGKLVRLGTPIPSGPSGQPSCCGLYLIPPMQIRAASSWEGLHTGCPACPGGAPLRWSVVVAGGTGDFAVFNGEWELHSPSTCGWTAQDLDRHVTVTLTVGSISELHFSGPPVGTLDATYLRAAAAVCNDCFDLAFHSQVGGSGTMPSTLRVCPDPHPLVLSFAGQAAALLTPGSAWASGYESAGAAGLALSPSSAWSTPYAYDSPACPGGAQLAMTFDSSAWTDDAALIGSSFRLTYGGSGSYSYFDGSFSVSFTLVDGGGFAYADMAVVYEPTGESAQYHCEPFDCTGSNTWNLVSQSGGFGCSGSIPSVPS